MKIKISVEFECCEYGADNGSCNGEVIFDEFGIVKKVIVNNGYGKGLAQKDKVKCLLKNVAQRARSEIIN